MRTTTLLFPHLSVNGNLPGAFLILDITELPLIRWTILMSPGGRTRDDNTSRPFGTYAGTLDGSWSTVTGWCVTCQSGFLGSMGMSRLFPGLLQTLSFLRQMTWPRPSLSLLYMSLVISRGVIQLGITNRGHILKGTWDGSLEYHILLWTPCIHSWLRSWCPSSSCPSLRGGYCWAAVGQTSSRPILDHQQHQGQSGRCNETSCYVS